MTHPNRSKADWFLTVMDQDGPIYDALEVVKGVSLTKAEDRAREILGERSDVVQVFIKYNGAARPSRARTISVIDRD